MVIKAWDPGYLGDLLRLQNEFRSNLGKLRRYYLKKRGSTGVWGDDLMGKALALEV